MLDGSFDDLIHLLVESSIRDQHRYIYFEESLSIIEDFFFLVSGI